LCQKYKNVIFVTLYCLTTIDIVIIALQLQRVISLQLHLFGYTLRIYDYVNRHTIVTLAIILVGDA